MLCLLFLLPLALSNEIPYFATQLEGDSLLEYLRFKQQFFQVERCNFTGKEMKSRVMDGLFGEKRADGKVKGLIEGIINLEIPASFDARTHWPSCSTMNIIYNQGSCGSCWSFCTAETMSDRICVASSQQVEISADDILSCCGKNCGYGCGGGWPINAFTYWSQIGVVTGGSYASHKGCKPYEIAPNGGATTPACKMSCESGYPVSYANDKHFGKGSGYYIANNMATIQNEIMTHGPVTAIFTVYSDFYSYKSGVYVHTAGGYQGTHCVKVMGWGVENGTPYWLVANSWGENWGIGGFFKIRRGNNECGFEAQMSAAIPK